MWPEGKTGSEDRTGQVVWRRRRVLRAEGTACADPEVQENRRKVQAEDEVEEWGSLGQDLVSWGRGRRPWGGALWAEGGAWNAGGVAGGQGCGQVGSLD